MHMQTEMVETISTARNRLFNEVLAEWSTTERRDLTRLLRKLVDSANQALLAAETELR
jgi:23S rRNA A2030 N6-methylase RlmJ